MGTGDGQFVVDQAKRFPEKFCIGIDASKEGMAPLATRMSRPAKKGGLPNVLFVWAAAEALPAELKGLATEITVNYPWGSLLRALVKPEPLVVRQIASLAQEGASITILYNYTVLENRPYAEQLGLLSLQEKDLKERLIPGLRQEGVHITHYEWLKEEPEQLTTWGKRLVRGASRRILLVKGSVNASKRVRE